jgi:hypothetical protein
VLVASALNRVVSSMRVLKTAVDAKAGQLPSMGAATGVGAGGGAGFGAGVGAGVGTGVGLGASDGVGNPESPPPPPQALSITAALSAARVAIRAALEVAGVESGPLRRRWTRSFMGQMSIRNQRSPFDACPGSV